MYSPGDYLDLYDFRIRVTKVYEVRTTMLNDGRDAAAVIEGFRRERDMLFKTHPQSALDAEQRADFTALEYYTYNPDARVEAVVDPNVGPQETGFITSGGDSMPMRLVAQLHFAYRGQSASLAMYWIEVYGGGLYLCFRDATAPHDTYGGGRYLFDTVKGSTFERLPTRGGQQRIILDFNYAYNPSCAYNPAWSCPLAPPENHLPFAIEAGEKRFH